MSKKFAEPIHFIGIGGVGMSPLAELCHFLGQKVQGSDLTETYITQRLQALGINVWIGHDAKFTADAKTVVFSSAIKEDNVEKVAALKKGLAVVHRSDLLLEFMSERKPITVAGTHGKTTTAAMIAHVLTELGVDPTAAIGGKAENLGSSARLGKGPLFVAEADESDGSFLKYRPYIGVLTNIDLDHMDYFGTIEKVEKTFSQYLSHVDEEGVAIIGWDSPLARKVSEGMENRLTYGFLIGSEVRAMDYQSHEGSCRFRAVVERDVVDCQLRTIGRHNVSNALCALAVARVLELDLKKVVEALATFKGVSRRLNLIYQDEQFIILDDYAHNPGKISAVIASVKEAWPDKNLTVVYQPHRYSRLETMYNETMQAFRCADRVFVVPVYAAGEASTHLYTPEKVAGDLGRASKVSAVAWPSLQEAATVLTKVSPGIILTLGAGDVAKVANLLKEQLLGKKKT